jgi:hypothetical protein
MGSPQLEEAAILWNRADLLDPVLGRRRQGEQVPTPEAVVLLPLDDGLSSLGLQDRQAQRIRRLRWDPPGREELQLGAELDRLIPVLEEPSERDPVGRWQFQNALLI